MSSKLPATGKSKTLQHEAVEFPLSSPDALSIGGSLGRRSNLFKSTLKRPSLKSLRRSFCTSFHLNSDSAAASESESTVRDHSGLESPTPNPTPSHRHHHLLSLPSFHRHHKSRSFSQLGIGNNSTPRSTSSAGSGSDLEFDPDHDTTDTHVVHSFVVLGRGNRMQSENSVAQASADSSAKRSTSSAGSGSDLELKIDPNPDTDMPGVHSFVVLGRNSRMQSEDVNSVAQVSKEDTDALSGYISTPSSEDPEIQCRRELDLDLPLDLRSPSPSSCPGSSPALSIPSAPPLPAIDNIETVEIGITRSLPSPSRVDGSVIVPAIVVLGEELQPPDATLKPTTAKAPAPDSAAELVSPSLSSADNNVDVMVYGVPSISYRELHQLAAATEDVVISETTDDTLEANLESLPSADSNSGDIDTAIASRLVSNGANIDINVDVDTIISIQLDEFSKDGSELGDPHRCPEQSLPSVNLASIGQAPIPDTTHISGLVPSTLTQPEALHDFHTQSSIVASTGTNPYPDLDDIITPHLLNELFLPILNGSRPLSFYFGLRDSDSDSTSTSTRVDRSHPHSVHRRRNCRSEYERKRPNYPTVAGGSTVYKNPGFVQELTWLIWMSASYQVGQLNLKPVLSPYDFRCIGTVTTPLLIRCSESFQIRQLPVARLLANHTAYVPDDSEYLGFWSLKGYWLLVSNVWFEGCMVYGLKALEVRFPNSRSKEQTFWPKQLAESSLLEGTGDTRSDLLEAVACKHLQVFVLSSLASRFSLSMQNTTLLCSNASTSALRPGKRIFKWQTRNGKAKAFVWSVEVDTRSETEFPKEISAVLPRQKNVYDAASSFRNLPYLLWERRDTRFANVIPHLFHAMDVTECYRRLRISRGNTTLNLEGIAQSFEVFTESFFTHPPPLTPEAKIKTFNKYNIGYIHLNSFGAFKFAKNACPASDVQIPETELGQSF
ncbi:hypothetical protein BT96DRAFT_978387 [Gymnopus androsaceus JB14]|uniref:Uncharacterized protein n=1 Tax=Gymnopus androsaceus JB14 TaxID=1447944 RepID=A0A6A4HBY7_9AGAR|nr:hypothetical protein BT96DRAFT_978387 [Gymnopus androsaceus JB14]